MFNLDFWQDLEFQSLKTCPPHNSSFFLANSNQSFEALQKYSDHHASQTLCLVIKTNEHQWNTANAMTLQNSSGWAVNYLRGKWPEFFFPKNMSTFTFVSYCPHSYCIFLLSFYLSSCCGIAIHRVSSEVVGMPNWKRICKAVIAASWATTSWSWGQCPSCPQLTQQILHPIITIGGRSS